MNQHINRNVQRVSAELVSIAATYQAAIWADVNGRHGALHGRIAPLSSHMACAGPALTVDVRPGDNLMIHAAIALAQPGDVLVVDGKGDLSAALMGALMMNACKVRRLAGVVVDGAVRDREELIALGFPVFAAGSNANGPTKNVLGRIGLPISCGGVTVNSGDLIVADADGAVAIERHNVSTLLPLVQQKDVDEAKRMKQILAGNTSANWLEGALRSVGALAAQELLLPSEK
jgi:4-hydroxy-4-methyl-2-oxoglutarate aldolase